MKKKEPEERTGILIEDGEKTIPWSSYEFIVVNGYKLVYTFDEDEMVVVFPGGKSVPISMLSNKHYKIVPPETIREWA